MDPMQMGAYGAGMDSAGMMFELYHTPVHPHMMEQVSAVQFDENEEVLWVGTERGGIHSLSCPNMEPYSRVTGHTSRVQGMSSTAAGILSVSAERLKLHSSGGLTLLSYETPKDQRGVADMLSCTSDMHMGRAIVGRKDGAVALHDLSSGKLLSRADVPAEAIAVRYPAGRGLIAAGCLNGSVVLLDPRSNNRLERTIVPHAGGLTTLDVNGDLLATAGLQVRMGQLSMDSLVQVYDIRGAPRPVSHIPFTAGATMLHFTPLFASSLMIGSAQGIFAMSDTSTSAIVSQHQVHCEGDMVMAASMASSSEMMAFGTTGGYLHLWGSSEMPKVNHYSRQTEFPSITHPRADNPADESINLAEAPQFICMDGRLLSEWDAGEFMSVGLPPRVVAPSLLKDLKQVDFVGYVSNPKYSRSRKPGESSWLVAEMRNRRVEVGNGKVNLERSSSKGPGLQLPARYHKMEIRELQSHVRFDDFDFSFYNRTKFAGLENSVANCYCNPLLQVLYFIPMMRGYLLQHVPDPDKEFSLTSEAAFLFRMLLSAPLYGAGATCQAANLLRSLRQSREASMLGLLEGHKNEPKIKGSRGDIEVETNKERSLSRRLQSLSRFLLEHLHREANGSQKQQGTPATSPKSPSSSSSARSLVSDIFGIEFRQRMQCLTGSQAETFREGHSFQVELQYPLAGKRPALSDQAAAATNKSRPSFASLLASSIRSQAEMKAWFDEKHGYQMLRQTRVPTRLPQVLVINCGLQDREDLAWWLPVQAAGAPAGETRPWLPWAVEVAAHPDSWEVTVDELSVAELGRRAAARDESLDSEDGTRAVYALTSSIVYIQEDGAAESQADAEGHVVALAKVLPHDYDPEIGINSPQFAVPTVETSAGSASAAAAAAAEIRKSAEAAKAKEEEGKAKEEEETGKEEPQKEEEEEEGEEEEGGSSPQPVALASAEEPQASPMPSLPIKPLVSQLSATGSVNLSPMPNMPMKTGNLLTQGWEGFGAWDEGWLIVNDFCIVPSSGEEVMRLYGKQKAPCLLYYTKVSSIQNFETAGAPELTKMSQIMDVSHFAQLCSAPPLQGSVAQLKKPTFQPLNVNKEPPAPGMLLAIDAEFVMFSPEEKVMVSGVETVTRPARLGLARISVLRGDPGPLNGECCIDDYVRTVEPVYDYLTRFSGLMPGDLDPSSSTHYLTTLKRAYMKLRYLVDVGCCFIGHGLKKDFRMININVPPEQVIDTVELFYLKRQRKLSLRFLASYLLGINIQENNHDSIEDARTALRLYEVYAKLKRNDQVEAKIKEIYRFGKEHGWEPIVPGSAAAAARG